MGEQGVTQARLGELLGIDGRQVRRILNPDHESKLSQLEAALAALGLRPLPPAWLPKMPNWKTALIGISPTTRTRQYSAGCRLRLGHSRGPGAGVWS